MTLIARPTARLGLARLSRSSKNTRLQQSISRRRDVTIVTSFYCAASVSHWRDLRQFGDETVPVATGYMNCRLTATVAMATPMTSRLSKVIQTALQNNRFLFTDTLTDVERKQPDGFLI